MATHAQSVVGTGGTAAGATTQIGNPITFPNVGPWNIRLIWGQIAKLTTAPNEGTGGQLLIDATSGDLTPDPAPGRWPLIGSPITESANASISSVPLNLWPVKLSASGKAIITMSYVQQLAIAAASQVAMGVIYDDGAFTPTIPSFCDAVSASFASATEQSIGTITLAEKATRIVGLLCDLNKGDASTIAEATMATFRLASADFQMQPASYPCNRAFNAGDGTAVGAVSTAMSDFIPVDIPIEGGARIDVFATTTQSVTGNADVQVFIAYV